MLNEMHSNAKQLLIIVYANMMFAYKHKCPSAVDPLYLVLSHPGITNDMHNTFTRLFALKCGAQNFRPIRSGMLYIIKRFKMWLSALIRQWTNKDLDCNQSDTSPALQTHKHVQNHDYITNAWPVLINTLRLQIGIVVKVNLMQKYKYQILHMRSYMYINNGDYPIQIFLEGVYLTAGHLTTDQN